MEMHLEALFAGKLLIELMDLKNILRLYLYLAILGS
jgi:hypothetical protein